MRADVELKLIHDGQEWIVSNDSYTASGKTFEALDNNLISALRNSGKFTQGTKVKVFMGFDFATFPTWLRQYHTHYFNRLVDVVV
ncbi:MAG: DUF5395 family protein [Gammaproteobacteria bacterium]|jgi:hypothetical protein